jgi:hypothetical protein
VANNHNSDLLKRRNLYYAQGEYREEIVTAALTYRGWAPKGSAESDNVWFVERQILAGGVTQITQAGATTDLSDEQIWANRASLFPAVPFADEYSTLFDGVNDYVDFGNNFNFERTDPFSFSFWVYLNSASGNQTIYSKQATTSSTGTRINFNAGRLELYLVNTQTTNQIRAQINSSGIIGAAAWKHCVITYNGSSDANGVKFYIDNILYATSATTNNLTATIITTDNVKIGVTGTSNYLNGALDEFSIWNKELSAAEVSSIYNSGNPANLANHSAYANLLSWWRMGDGDEYPVLTASKGLVNGSMTNMASSAFIRNVP